MKGLNIFSEENLSSQMYEKHYILVSIYSSDRIVFQGPGLDGKIVTLEFNKNSLQAENQINIPIEDEIIARIAFYEGNADSIRSYSELTDNRSIGTAIGLLSHCTYMTYLTLHSKRDLDTMEDFLTLLTHFKNNELKQAKPKIQEVMHHHDQIHGCFEMEKQSSQSRCSLM